MPKLYTLAICLILLCGCQRHPPPPSTAPAAISIATALEEVIATNNEWNARSDQEIAAAITAGGEDRKQALAALNRRVDLNPFVECGVPVAIAPTVDRVVAKAIAAANLFEPGTPIATSAVQALGGLGRAGKPFVPDAARALQVEIDLPENEGYFSDGSLVKKAPLWRQASWQVLAGLGEDGAELTPLAAKALVRHDLQHGAAQFLGSVGIAALPVAEAMLRNPRISSEPPVVRHDVLIILSGLGPKAQVLAPLLDEKARVEPTWAEERGCVDLVLARMQYDAAFARIAARAMSPLSVSAEIKKGKAPAPWLGKWCLGDENCSEEVESSRIISAVMFGPPAADALIWYGDRGVSALAEIVRAGDDRAATQAAIAIMLVGRDASPIALAALTERSERSPKLEKVAQARAVVSGESPPVGYTKFYNYIRKREGW